jgi:hypothetical protein
MMNRDELETEIANNMLTMTPGDFEAWLQAKCPADQPETPYGVYLSAHLAGFLGYAWAKQRAGIHS